jgi:hypothetical protein
MSAFAIGMILFVRLGRPLNHQNDQIYLFDFSKRFLLHLYMAKTASKKNTSLRFESVNFDSIFQVLDAIAFLDFPDVKAIAQFAGIDPRTAGKILKNAIQIGSVQELDKSYTLSLPYPYKGSLEQKKIVIKESLVRVPILINVRQFLSLGDNLGNALRKAATIIGIKEYDSSDFTPLIKWATQLGALEPKLVIEDLVDEATKEKEKRHKEDAKKKVVFISHSSKDKPTIRQLATDLKNENIDVWLDEQKILVGDSISEKIGQGLAESDYFIIALSDNSVKSDWVKKELSNAIVKEIERRKTTILPIKLSEAEIPDIIKDKKYADFSTSYKNGLAELIKTIKNE